MARHLAYARSNEQRITSAYLRALKRTSFAPSYSRQLGINSAQQRRGVRHANVARGLATSGDIENINGGVT